MSVLNSTDNNLDEFIGIVEKFLPFAKEQLEINEMPSIELISDSQNAVNLLGKTAYYDPSAQKVVVYADNRHAKDMLRSISHELVHHAQNQSGMFEGQLMMGDDYAQTNPHLREMEEDANLRGCMCVRDFVDQKIHLEETNSKRRVNSMKITEKELRATVRNLIKENMPVKNMDPYHRDEDAYQVPTRAEGDNTPLSPQDVRAFLEATGRGSEVDNPAGYAERRTEEIPLEPALNDAEAAAAADAAESADAPKKKEEPKKEVIAKKAPVKEKKAVKEWYGEELFGKLLKEAVK